MTENLTIEQLIHQIANRFEKASLFYGHGTNNSFDEACALVFHVLNLSFDVESEQLSKKVTEVDLEKILNLCGRRIKERIPLSYLTNEIYFAGLKFYIDERSIIPRSPFAELIENKFMPWAQPENVKNILDLCTGSGCMAIACAKFFPNAVIDAVDISKDALEVAKINVEMHNVKNQVHLIDSDLFNNLKNKKYDLIISNPPYVGSEEMKALPKEYIYEPKLALQANDDGLEIVARILKQSKDYLKDQGVLIVEVGNSQELLEQRFPKIPFIWLEFEYGGEGVFLLTPDKAPSLDL